MEPALGFEPRTDGLQNRSSTAELSRPDTLRVLIQCPASARTRCACCYSVRLLLGHAARAVTVSGFRSDTLRVLLQCPASARTRCACCYSVRLPPVIVPHSTQSPGQKMRSTPDSGQYNMAYFFQKSNSFTFFFAFSWYSMMIPMLVFSPADDGKKPQMPAAG